MTEKHDNFVRLAERRVETVCDGIRVFSNLCSANYEWESSEVLDYAKRIVLALEEALGRFREQKRWIEPEDENGSPEAPEAFAEHPAPEQIYLEPVIEVFPHQERERRRAYTITEIIRNAKSDPEPLAATIALQREVIENLKEQLAQLSTQP